VRRQVKDTFPDREHLGLYWGRLGVVCGGTNQEIESAVAEQVEQILEHWFKTNCKYANPWVPASREIARVVVGLLTTSEIERQLSNEAAIRATLLDRLNDQRALRESIESTLKLCNEWRPGVFDFRLQAGGHFVYALYEKIDLGGEILNYIGETQNLFARIARHRSEKKIPFSEFAVIECSNELDRLKLEKELIKQFDPPYNKKHAGRGYGKVAA